MVNGGILASPNPATKLYCSEPSVVRSRDTAQASLAQEGRSQKKKKKKRKAGPGAAGHILSVRSKS